MNCLSCNNEMIDYEVIGPKTKISYDTCEKCGSFWLDAGELKNMAYQVAGDIEVCSKEKVAGSTTKTKKCPRCSNTALEKVGFLGLDDIVLDRCNNCGGFWLDGGELDLINKELKNIMPIQGKGFSEFVNSFHLPHWYKKVRRRSEETDFKVDVLPIKDSKHISTTSYLCPSCNNLLNTYSVFGIDYEGCPKCKGVFLDKNELRKIKDRSVQYSWDKLNWMDDEVESIEKTRVVRSKRICPKCKGMKLFSTIVGGTNIFVDWCPSCHGIWLDHDELSEIIDALKEKLHRMSSSEMAKNVYKEIKEIWSGPENVISEIMDAKATIWAFINLKIFEHPTLTNMFMEIPK